MTWTLKNSRSVYFRETGDDPSRNPWSDEVNLMRGAGYAVAAGDDLSAWDPTAAEAQAKCPSLDQIVRELKGLVGPMWRARVSNIYAGRTHSKQETALSAHGPKGGMVAISFDFTYALLATAITWGDFLQYLDQLMEDADVLAKADALRAGLRTAFDV